MSNNGQVAEDGQVIIFYFLIHLCTTGTYTCNTILTHIGTYIIDTEPPREQKSIDSSTWVYIAASLVNIKAGHAKIFFCQLQQ